MVVPKILSRLRFKLADRQVVTIAEIDRLLDVESDRFSATARRLGAAFAACRATLDLEGHRAGRFVAASSAESVDLPDVRDAFYQSELRRISPMDREEEFRMARRYEFVRGIVRAELESAGLAPDEASTAAARPAREIRSALEGRSLRRGVDPTWFAALVVQFEQLRNLYVEGALYIVLTTVNRYRGLGVDTADLIQEGNSSLFQAIEGFDWRRDVRFRTYAQYWVHQAVLKMLYNSSRTVRVPIWVQKLLGKIRKVQNEERRAGREATLEEIGRRVGITADKVQWILNTRRYAVSLDAETAPGEGGALGQLLPDTSVVPIPDSIPPGDLRVALDTAMADLPPREQRILRRRFGLDGQEPQTLGEIASELGVTAERVRQLQNAAIGRIKKPSKLQALQAFVE